MIFQWLIAPEWANLVKVLLHTLWQGAAIALLLGGALRQLANPVVRYRCALAALAGVLMAGVVTWAVLSRPLPPVAAVVSAGQPAPAAGVTHPASDLPPVVVNVSRLEPRPTTIPWSAWLALVWLLGATAMIVRGGWQVAGAERLRRAAQPLADERLAGMLEEARRAVGLARRVRLAATDRLTSPAVVGVLVPTLILPLSLVTTLTPEQIRFVLLHELAHIRRGDYFASLFQLFAEALLFFNPAVWWISRQMRREREVCCDTLAVELSGAPVAYARTLLCVAENVLQPAPAAALAFGDRPETSPLADRVQRMLVPGYQPKLRLTWRAMLLALFLGGGLLFLSALGTSVTVAAVANIGGIPAEPEAGTNSSPASLFFTRAFPVDANVFIAQVRNLAEVGEGIGEATNSLAVAAAARKYFNRVGINLESPAGKAVFFNDQTGIMVVRATVADLDMAERALQALNQVAPQIHLKARFYAVPKGTFRDLVQPNLLTDEPVNALKSETNAWAGLLAEDKFRIVLSVLSHSLAVEDLAAPEAITLSGRQTQLKVTEPVTYVSDIVAAQQLQFAGSPAKYAADIPGFEIMTNSLEVGPSLDAAASLLSDGYTINLWTCASLTKFGGYKMLTPTNDASPYLKYEGTNPPKVFPQICVQQASALLNLWDGQTVVLGQVDGNSSFVRRLTMEGWLPVPKNVSPNQELLVFITVTLVDQAGNRVHGGDELPFAAQGIPPQPSPAHK